MSHNEWEMLCISEDIEPGDTIIAENIYDTNNTISVVVCRESSDGQWVQTRDATGKAFTFNTDSLEQKGKRTKQWRIKRKSPISIRLPKLNTLDYVESVV